MLVSRESGSTVATRRSNSVARLVWTVALATARSGLVDDLNWRFRLSVGIELRVVACVLGVDVNVCRSK